MTETAIALAQALVRIASENPPGDERACAEFIHGWFDERDADVTLVVEPEGERPSVAARIGSGHPEVVLNGHTDVVPVGERNTWSVDPYGGVIADGRLYGRGAADMKAGLAIAMVTALELRDELEAGDLDGSVIVHAAAGEETGYPGTAALIEAGFGGDLAIVLEPTDVRVATSARGVATFRLSVPGTAAHASRPQDGTNAVDRLRDVLDGIEGYDEEVRQRHDPLVGRPRATVTEVRAGLESNMAVIPDRASLLLDRRTIPGETLGTIEGELDALGSSLPRFDVDRSLVQWYEPASIDADHPLARVVRQHAADLADASTEPWGLEAATDARSFIADDIPAIIWGPGRLEQAHTVDEWIDLEAIDLGKEILTRAVRDLLGDD